jgi:hypothetical protein
VGAGIVINGTFCTLTAIGVIVFEPTRVSPIADFDGFAIDGIGPDPGYLQPVCTRGGATGFGCGVIKFGGVKPAIVATDMPARWFTASSVVA